MSYEIVHLPRAQSDLEEILAWLHERSPSGAARWFARWLEVEELLRRTPESQARAPESSDHDEEIRNVIFRRAAAESTAACFWYARRRCTCSTFADPDRIWCRGSNSGCLTRRFRLDAVMPSPHHWHCRLEVTTRNWL